MNKYYKIVIDYFGEEWFKQNWEQFCAIRKKHPLKSFAKEILVLELSLHPLLKQFFYCQSGYDSPFDFTKVPEKSAADFLITHLGRDLDILQSELSERGNKIKDDLMISEHYEAHRFTLLVAAGYKLLGYAIFFIPTSEKKTADLFVKKGTQEYYIECKQRNQEVSDKSRYEVFGELVEVFMNLLRVRNLRDIFIDIKVTGDVYPIKKQIAKELNNFIWRNQKSKSIANFNIRLHKASLNTDFISLLKSGGHFNNVPVFTRTEDGFIASDPDNKNIIMLDKNIREEKIPSNVYAELYDANEKEKLGILLLYYDFGRGFTSWTDTFSKEIFQKFEEVRKNLKNIDGFVICQTQLKNLGGITQIKPNFNFMGSTTELKGTPEQLNLFGCQGKTGMDEYLIKEFIQS